MYVCLHAVIWLCQSPRDPSLRVRKCTFIGCSRFIVRSESGHEHWTNNISRLDKVVAIATSLLFSTCRTRGGRSLPARRANLVGGAMLLDVAVIHERRASPHHHCALSRAGQPYPITRVPYPCLSSTKKKTTVKGIYGMLL